MTAEQLNREVLNLTDHNHTYSDQIYALTLAMIDIDEVRFEKVMARNIMQFGLEKTMINIVYPFLVKMGLMWQTGSITPAQEHFMSNLIRQKLIVAIDGQYGVPKEGSKKFMLYLGEGELHELSLLFTHYLVKSRHHKSIYLGQWLPYQDLEDMYKTHRPDYLVTVLTSQPFNMEVDTYITKLATSFPDVNIVLSGYQTIGLSMKLPANVRIIKNIESFITFLDEEL